MADSTLIQTLLIPMALAAHDAVEHLGDICEVRDRASRRLPGLDAALVEDLLISASALLAGIGLDVEGLVRQWSAPALRSAAPRLTSVLKTIVEGA